MESKPRKARSATPTGLLPRPRSMGSFFILLSVLAFIAGRIRNELALTLLGTLFLIILAYCFFGVFLLGLVNRRKGQNLSMVITGAALPAGGEGELCVTNNLPQAKNNFWRLPMVLIRCELFIETRDGRVIRHYANPGVDKYSKFPVRERGAYYGERDSFIVFDAPGFFRLAFPLQHNTPGNVRLLAVPRQAEETIPLSLKSGGTEERNEPHYRKSDELIDHRPYIPGDDPRRINWKLYSHTPMGDLFVREGENEPPPRSRLLILIDTEVDHSLYSPDEGRKAVDLLCESALAAAQEFSNRGMDILVGYTGGRVIGGNDEGLPLNITQIAAALAWPAAIFRSKDGAGAESQAANLPGTELPHAPNDRAVLILALPRTFISGASALDRFLRKREANQETDLVFLYNEELRIEDLRTKGSRRAAELQKAASLCVNLYSGRSGVHAIKAALPPEGTK